MKAVKLYNIQWNTKGVDQETVAKLPTHKGFTTTDDFNVAQRVPAILKKKYGVEVLGVSFQELRIVETVEELLLLFVTEVGEKPKCLFKVKGGLSLYGEKLFKALENQVKLRIRNEMQGMDPWQFPVIQDEIQLAWEKITGEDWEGKTVEEILNPIADILKTKKIGGSLSKYGTVYVPEVDDDECEAGDDEE